MAIVTPRDVQVLPPSSRINYKRRPAPSHSNTTLKLLGLRNLCNAEILLGIAGQSGFWERLDATTRSPNVYVLYFLVAEHLRPLLPCGRTSTSSSWWPNVYVLYILVVVPVFPK